MKKIIPLIFLAASLCFAVNVGVLGYGSCPFSNSLAIMLDAEDNNNQSGWFWGYHYPLGITFPDGHVMFYICKIDASILRKVPYDYMVFRLGDQCPSGGKPVRRHHDTEDHNPENAHLKDVSPSTTGRDVDLEFCFMPATPGATNDFPLPPSIQYEHSIFANVGAGYIRTSVLRIDDENNNNQNGWAFYDRENTTLPERVENIMTDIDGDTYYCLARKVAPLTKKTSEVEANGPFIANDNAAFNKSAKAEVMGFNHTTVSFELKSAGPADITIANAKGAVVSRISKEYLNPGVHSVEWHSGILPNGLYIVTIKHNGSVSSKTFALK